MTENPPERTMSTDAFATDLYMSGMAEKKAEVFAYREYQNLSNQETADKLGKDKSTVSQYYYSAQNEALNASRIDKLCNKPRFLTALGTEVGTFIDEHIEHTVAFRLHQPSITDNNKYNLNRANVIEAFHLKGDSFLIAYYRGDNQQRGTASSPAYYTVKSQHIISLIVDWLVPNRYEEFEGDTDTHTDRWFVTDTFGIEGLENELNNFNIERIEILTNDNFTNPCAESRVIVKDSATTGVYSEGFKIAYSPTKREVAELLRDDEISERKAEKITRLQRDELEEIA